MIRITLGFWVMALIIGLLFGGSVSLMLLWAIGVFFSVLVHECGHALMMRLFGNRPRIQLVFFGGVTTASGKKLPLLKEFLVVLMGPIFGIFLAIFSYVVLEAGTFHNTALEPLLFILLYLNIIWSILNLLPVHPLDGGKLLGIVLQGAFGFRGWRNSFLVSAIFSCFLSVYFFMEGALFGGLLFFLLAYQGVYTWKVIPENPEKQRRLRKILEKAEDFWRKKEEKEAIALLHSAQKEYVSSESLLGKLTEYLLQTKDFREVYELLKDKKKELNPLLLEHLQRACYETEKWQEVIEVGENVYRELPLGTVAVMNACASGKIGDAIRAVHWLQAASKDPGVDLTQIVSSDYFDEIRKGEVFDHFEKTAQGLKP